MSNVFRTSSDTPSDVFSSCALINTSLILFKQKLNTLFTTFIGIGVSSLSLRVCISSRALLVLANTSSIVVDILFISSVLFAAFAALYFFDNSVYSTSAFFLISSIFSLILFFFSSCSCFADSFKLA